MRLLFNALLAATALLPAATAASAQEEPSARADGPRDGRNGRDYERVPFAERRARETPPPAPRVEPDRGRVDRPRDDDRGRGRWEGRRDDRVAPVSPPPSRPDIRPDRDRPRSPDVAVRGDRTDRDRLGRDDRREWNRPRFDRGRDDGRPRIDPARGDGRADRNRPQIRDRRDDDRGGWNRPGIGDWRSDRRYDDGGSWNRGWRGDDRYDWSRYRSNNRGAYRLPRYYAPSDWDYGYRRFGVGVRLSMPLFAENYWIDDPFAYRLPDAYGPYRWVRYYNDALLVDLRYGRVVDVVYDIFW